MKSYPLTYSSNTGHFDQYTYWTYDLIKEKVKVEVGGGDREIEPYTSKKEYKENIKMVKHLARKEQKRLVGAIKNNREVIVWTEDDPKEKVKAERHLALNLERQTFIEEFIVRTKTSK